MPFQLSPRREVLFSDRTHAGEELAQAVLQAAEPLRASHRFVVYALPRGGLPVAAPIATALDCPLDVIVAKKVTRPDNPELAIGAVTADGHVLSAEAQLSSEDWQQAVDRAKTKAQQQLEQFTDRSNASAENAIALLVDDGIATGMTMAVAAMSLREQHPQEIWICVPVAPGVAIESIRKWCDFKGNLLCDRLIVLATPDPFWSVSRFYQSFPQVEMEEALMHLKNSVRN